MNGISLLMHCPLGATDLAPCGPDPGRERERPETKNFAAADAYAAYPWSSDLRYSPARPTPSVNGSHWAAKVACSTATGSFRYLAYAGLRNSSVRCRSPPAMRD